MLKTKAPVMVLILGLLGKTEAKCETARLRFAGRDLY
jgi:hypothetical protein